DLSEALACLPVCQAHYMHDLRAVRQLNDAHSTWPKQPLRLLTTRCAICRVDVAFCTTDTALTTTWVSLNNVALAVRVPFLVHTSSQKYDAMKQSKCAIAIK